MRELKIRLPDQLIILKPVPFANLRSLETMLEELQALWLKADAAIADLLLGEDGAIAITTAQKIVDLHPRIDEPGKMGFDITPLLDDLTQFEELLFCTRDSDDKLDVLTGGLIVRLNKFSAVAKYQRAVKLLADQESKAAQQTTEEQSPVAGTLMPILLPTSA